MPEPARSDEMPDGRGGDLTAGTGGRHVQRVRAADLLHHPARLDARARVGIQVEVRLLGVRVPPGEREHLHALRGEPLDDAAPGRKVPGVVLVDRRRDDHDRHLPHRVGRRRVLDQLEDLGPVHHRPWRHRDIHTHRELRGVDAGRDAGRRRHVPQQVPRSGKQVGAAVVDRHLERGRVRPREVRRRQRIGDVLDREPQLLLGGPVELGVADQIVSRGASGEVGLHDAPEQPAVLPGRIGEAPVLRARSAR